MTKNFFKNLFDTIGFSSDFDPIIAEKIDTLSFNSNTRETLFLDSAFMADSDLKEEDLNNNNNGINQKWEQPHS